jgi:hypothetical protein
MYKVSISRFVAKEKIQIRTEPLHIPSRGSPFRERVDQCVFQIRAGRKLLELHGITDHRRDMHPMILVSLFLHPVIAGSTAGHGTLWRQPCRSSDGSSQTSRVE